MLCTGCIQSGHQACGFRWCDFNIRAIHTVTCDDNREILGLTVANISGGRV